MSDRSFFDAGFSNKPECENAASRQSRSKALLANLAGRWELEAMGMEQAMKNDPAPDPMAPAEIELRVQIRTMRGCAKDAREFAN